MRKIHKVSTKIILAISAIWMPFVVVGVWYDMEQAKNLALNEVLRWGTSTGETVRIALNTLMREGKMDARFSLFSDLTTEISGLDSIRVIRSSRVNEIFHRVREENDIPREQENIRIYREQISALLTQLDQTRDPDERADLVNDITDISYDINHSEDLLLKYSTPIPIDQREAARDEIERRVLETGTLAYIVDDNRMRIVAPYKAQKTGCSEASGCHYYAKEGDVLGAVNMEFSIERINKEVMLNTVTSIILKVFVSLLILALIYGAINVIVIKNINRLTWVMKKITSGDLNAHLSLKRRKSDNVTSTGAAMIAGDELDYLLEGFSSMAEKIKHDQDELKKLAAYDDLTGLYNRRKFTSSLQEEIAVHKRDGEVMSLLIIDLDHFKNINDTFGHQAGDATLQTVAKVINSHVRRGDISARYGGEEIAVILPRTTGVDALKLAERIRCAIEGTGIEYEPGRTLRLTASIGAATMVQQAANDNDLIQAADAALYTAKRHGRNCVRTATASPAKRPVEALPVNSPTVYQGR